MFWAFDFGAGAQKNDLPDFSWGNTSYYNLSAGDSVVFNDVTIELLNIEGRFNTIKVGKDTFVLNVAQRSLPVTTGGLAVFVADNSNLKTIGKANIAHGLLKKDVLLGVAKTESSLLNTSDFVFPVTFNHGFIWSGEEDSYLYSLTKNRKTGEYFPYPGIGINLNDARMRDKHWIAALEDCTVEWIEENSDNNAVCLLLASSSNPGIYYVYDGMYQKNVEVRKGQKLQKGEIIGTAWGDDIWCYLQLAVVYSEKTPEYRNRYANVLNFFPQLYELYYQHLYNVSRSFSKGKIEFGRLPALNGNIQNASGFEDYLGKGWQFGKWNTANKLEWVAKGDIGNVRLSKTLFSGTKAECTNPQPYFEYSIAVKNGTYRIRAKVGDIEKNSWQKIAFENLEGTTFDLGVGEQKWTSERVVRISDHQLNIRIYVDQENNTVAGLSEIVFQQAY